MTRLAVLADIHGNLPALEAVMDDLRHTVPDQVVVAGDVVNRGPQSRECLAAVRAMGWPVVFGNHEDYILKFHSEVVPDEWLTDWWLPTRRVAEELSADDIAYLRALPWSHVVSVPGLPAIRIVHGSPRGLSDGLGFWMTDEELLDAFQALPEPIMIGAHTHRPLDRRIGERWALNCGAVGAPFNGNPAAQYLVLTAHDGEWQAEFRAVPYDRAPLYEVWDRTDLLRRSMIAQIFKYEIETATYHMGLYIEFCERHGLPQNDQASFDHYRRASRHVTPGCSFRIRHAPA